ncbi:hypothetical protein OGATHE_002353, partial [Ogataea polymorpha]
DEATKLIKSMLANAEYGFVEVDITRDCQYFHLAVALILTYGYEIDVCAPASAVSVWTRYRSLSFSSG